MMENNEITPLDLLDAEDAIFLGDVYPDGNPPKDDSRLVVEGDVYEDDDASQKVEGNSVDLSGIDSDDDSTESFLPTEESPMHNPIAILGRAFIEEGILPEDVDIPDNITDFEFAQLYRKAKEAEIRQEIIDDIVTKEGLSREAIETAKQIHFGVKPQEVSQERLYTTLAGYNIDEGSDTFDDDVEQYLTLYYKDIQFNEKLIPAQVDRDLGSDDDYLFTLLDTAQDHFKRRAKQIADDNAEKANKARQDMEDEQKAYVDRLNRVLNSGEIAGVKYSQSDMKKLRSALFDKTESVKSSDGSIRKITLYDRKRAELLGDMEQMLGIVAKVILGDRGSTETDVTVEKAKRSILSDLTNVASSYAPVSGRGRASGENIDSITRYGKELFSI